MSNISENSTATTTSPRRLRNDSYKQSLKPQISQDTPSPKMSGNMEKIIEEAQSENGHCIIPKDDFLKKSTAQKLDAVADAINKMYQKINEMPEIMENKVKPVKEAVFDTEDGILPQMESLINYVKDSDHGIKSLTEENLQLRDELDILKGIVHKMAN